MGACWFCVGGVGDGDGGRRAEQDSESGWLCGFEEDEARRKEERKKKKEGGFFCFLSLVFLICYFYFRIVCKDFFTHLAAIIASMCLANENMTSIPTITIGLHPKGPPRHFFSKQVSLLHRTKVYQYVIIF